MAICCASVDLRADIDDLDRQIIALLREDARRSFQDIGQHVALSAPAVKRRVDRLRKAGVIRGFTTIVDPRRFGWQTQAIVELTTEGRFSGVDILTAIRTHPEVAAAYTVAGQASAILIVRAEDTVHLEAVLERLRETPAITRTRTAVVLSTLLERPFEG
jgi:DNA-binding Lrp family transcriptional regulator